MTDSKNTRERILEAAADIFGEQGFKAATVRQICDRAGANVAAVNYYFKDKHGLYTAVIEDLFSSGFEKFPPDMGADADAPPEKRLKAFVRAFFLRLTSKNGWGNFAGRGKLMLREFAEPSPALDHIVEKYIRPHKEILTAVISDLLGPSATPEKVTRCTLSVAGQCLHYAVARPVIKRVAQGYEPKAADIEKIAEHITSFSLGGIQSIRQKAEDASDRDRQKEL